MPAGDGSGPAGRGPMTGRGAGYCSGFAAPGWANDLPARGFGRGWGRGGGGGRGWRNRNRYRATGTPGWARYGYAPDWGYGASAAGPDQEQEMEGLRQQAEWLKQQLDAIGQRIDELEPKE